MHLSPITNLNTYYVGNIMNSQIISTDLDGILCFWMINRNPEEILDKEVYSTGNYKLLIIKSINLSSNPLVIGLDHKDLTNYIYISDHTIMKKNSLLDENLKDKKYSVDEIYGNQKCTSLDISDENLILVGFENGSIG